MRIKAVIWLAVCTIACMANTLAACELQRWEYKDGQIKDLETGLVWFACAVNSDKQCSTALVNWPQALQVAEAEESSGWRLPNLMELATVADSSCPPSQSFLTLLSNGGGGLSSFWTSTPSLRSPSLAWAIDLSARSTKLTDRQTLAHGVLLVRDWREGDD